MTQTADPASSGVAAADDTVSLTRPRKVAADIVNCSPQSADRLHHLLSRNANGDLNTAELGELEALAEIAQLKQRLALAMGVGAAA